MRRLLSPGLLVLHVLVLGMVVVTTLLGQWQLRRLGEARDRIATQETNLAREPVTLDAIPADPDDLEYRRIRVVGTYDPDREVLLRNRAHEGQLGWHVLTPLVLADGSAMLTNRGWVPFEESDPPIDAAPPPEGEVEVTGFVRATQPQPRFGAKDPEQGDLEQVFRVDLERLAAQFPYELQPAWLTVEASNPAGSSPLPVRAGAPELDEGPHLYYAIQWFSIGAVGVVTYVVYLRKRLREPLEVPPLPSGTNA